MGNVGQLSDDLQTEWPIWRLWLDKGGDIRVYQDWPLSDVLKANAVLDMKQAYESGLDALMEKESKKGK